MKWMYLFMFQINDNQISSVTILCGLILFDRKSQWLKIGNPPNKQGVCKVPKPVIS